MIAAPAAGLEQLGKVIKPPLGKIAPTRDNVAATRHVCSMSHEPARKEKNGRRRNGDESIGRDRDILWKTLAASSERHLPITDRRQKTGEIPVVRPIHSLVRKRHGRTVAETVSVGA